MKRVLVFGAFDGFHEGHAAFLRQAREGAARLIVSLARDDFVESYKGRLPAYPQAERRRRLLTSGLVDEVHLSDAVPGSFRLVRELKPDLICLGYDQSLLRECLLSWLRSGGEKIPIALLEHYPTTGREDGPAAKRRGRLARSVKIP